MDIKMAYSFFWRKNDL